MNYLCLVYRETMGKGDQQQGQGDAIEEEVRAYDEGLQLSGRYVAAGSIQIAEATRFRVRGHKICIDDELLVGPHVSLDSFYLISARDLNDAIMVAARIPQARRGCIEVWPVYQEGE